MNCQNLSGFLESKHLHWSFRTQVESKSVKCTMIMLTEDIFALKYEKLKVAKSYISETGCYLQQLLTLLLKPEQNTLNCDLKKDRVKACWIQQCRGSANQVHKVNKDAICLNIVMAFPHSHKTVFVLDHGPYFALPCHQVEFDVARRGGPGT